jgi:hypothetical protein
MTSLMTLPLYHMEKIPIFQLDVRLGGPQNLPGCCGEEKNLALSGTGVSLKGFSK